MGGLGLRRTNIELQDEADSREGGAARNGIASPL
jgi:hypothetical protein